MGRTTETVIVQNLFDVNDFMLNKIKENQIREVKIEAVVDTGATYLCLPPKVIKELGLIYSHSSKVRTASGNISLEFYQTAKIIINDRFTTMMVMQNLSDDVPALIGVLILEALDYVVNSNSQKLIGNPEHGGEWMVEAF